MLISRLGVLLCAFATAIPLAVAQPSSASGQAPQPASPQPYPASPSPYGTPTYPPSPYAPQPYPPSPPANCLACPAGSVCMNGTCAPPYPQCPPGTAFDLAGYCVPAGYAPYPTNYESPMEAQARAEREKRRMRPKFTIDLEAGGGIILGTPGDPVMMPMFGVLLGTCLHVAPWFGLIFRGGPLIGVAVYEDTQGPQYSTNSKDEDTTRMIGVIAEALPFFRTSGRFYWGPLLSAMYMSFGSPGLHSNGSYVSLNGGATGAFGLAMGWLLGKEEKTALSFSLQGSPANKATIFFTARIGFQL